MQVTPDSRMLDYYSAQSAVTDPRKNEYLYGSLPDAAIEIGAVFQNILLHNWKTYAEGIQLSETRRAEIEIRPVARLLERIKEVDERPWSIERPVEHRVVVDCRHFATMLCSVLRSRGIPSRTRHGFASYLVPGHFQSHVVCEYWNAAEDRWILVDADTMQQDMPVGRFISADQAWRGIEAGELDASQFGYGPDIRGAWCVRWEVIRDFAGLNKQEMLTFDVWGLNASYEFSKPLLPQDADLLNNITALLEDQRQNFSALRAIYQSDDRVRVPSVIRSQPYTTGLTHTIDLSADGSMNV